MENITVELDTVQVICLAQFCFFCGNGFNFRKLSNGAVLLYSPLYVSGIIEETSFLFHYMLLSFLVHGKRSVDSTGKFRIILASENFNDRQGNRVGGIWWC